LEEKQTHRHKNVTPTKTRVNQVLGREANTHRNPPAYMCAM